MSTTDNVAWDPETLAEMWRKALQEHRQDGLQERLQRAWPDDKLGSRISYAFPPTFQPGYVGAEYGKCRPRLLVLAQNPGAGGDAASVARDRMYQRKLEDFRDGAVSFAGLNAHVMNDLLAWPTYAGKGIFREHAEGDLQLLPTAVRPSIRTVAYVNTFPFKTPSGVQLRNAGFAGHMWKTFVGPCLRMLAPDTVVHFPGSDPFVDDIRALLPGVTICRVWHPSEYNAKAQRKKLIESWQSLGKALGEQSKCGSGVHGQAVPAAAAPVSISPAEIAGSSDIPPKRSAGACQGKARPLFRPKEGYAMVLALFLDELGRRDPGAREVWRLMEDTFLPYKSDGSVLAEWDEGKVVYLPDCRRVMTGQDQGGKLADWPAKGQTMLDNAAAMEDIRRTLELHITDYDAARHAATLQKVRARMQALVTNHLRRSQ